MCLLPPSGSLCAACAAWFTCPMHLDCLEALGVSYFIRAFLVDLSCSPRNPPFSILANFPSHARCLHFGRRPPSSRGESGWCPDGTSTPGAWRHAGVQFLLSGEISKQMMSRSAYVLMDVSFKHNVTSGEGCASLCLKWGCGHRSAMDCCKSCTPRGWVVPYQTGSLQ